jgi:RNA polymerase sigma-70 factor (ECF subfamily)
MTEMNEEKLIRAVQEGDTELFAELIPTHKGRIFATLLGILKNTEDAKDLTQEVFLKAFRRIERFEFRSSFHTWLHRIAVNAAIDFKRKRKNKIMLGIDENKGGLDVLLKDAAVKPRETFPPIERETQKLIMEAIHALDPMHRAIIQMREVEGYSYKEIAQQLKITQGTVMSRLFYARRKLKEHLQTLEVFET